MVISTCVPVYYTFMIIETTLGTTQTQAPVIHSNSLCYVVLSINHLLMLKNILALLHRPPQRHNIDE